MRILLAEHDTGLAHQVTEWLEAAGHAVDVWENGDLALQFVMDANGSYEIIMLDATLPLVNGLHIYERMREKHIQIPVLLLVTSEDLEGDMPAPNGTLDYLVKPFTEKELLLRTGGLRTRSQIFAPISITCGTVILNMRNRSLSRDGKSITLTHKETLLLEYFMTHPNTIVGRRELFVAAWGEASLFGSNIIDVHVKNVRKKLQRLGSEMEIETIRRLGYRLEVRT